MTNVTQTDLEASIEEQGNATNIVSRSLLSILVADLPQASKNLLAKKLGLSPRTLSRRVIGIGEFSYTQVRVCHKHLESYTQKKLSLEKLATSVLEVIAV